MKKGHGFHSGIATRMNTLRTLFTSSDTNERMVAPYFVSQPPVLPVPEMSVLEPLREILFNQCSFCF